MGIGMGMPKGINGYLRVSMGISEDDITDSVSRTLYSVSGQVQVALFLFQSAWQAPTVIFRHAIFPF